MVNSGELHLQYRYAIQLIKGQQYAEAYDILKMIDQERPNTKNVLYAMAVAADAAGMTDEALPLCDRLIMEFDHDKAKIIRDRILRGQTIRLKSLGGDSESLGLPSSLTGLSSGMNAASSSREPSTETLWKSLEEGKKAITPPAAADEVLQSSDEDGVPPAPATPEEEQQLPADAGSRKKRSFFSWGRK